MKSVDAEKEEKKKINALRQFWERQIQMPDDRSLDALHNPKKAFLRIERFTIYRRRRDPSQTTSPQDTTALSHIQQKIRFESHRSTCRFSIMAGAGKKITALRQRRRGRQKVLRHSSFRGPPLTTRSGVTKSERELADDEAPGP